MMQKAAVAFECDTSRSDKREVMKEASRDLLMTVVRLMVIADAVDVSKLFNVSNRVSGAVYIGWFHFSTNFNILLPVISSWGASVTLRHTWHEHVLR